MMITDGKKRSHIAVKRFSILLKGITSNHVGDFYCLSCPHSFRQENKLKKHEKLCKNYDYCYIEMPKENKKIIKYNHREKSMKIPCIIYADMECFLERIDTCHNKLKESSTTKTTRHLASSCSSFTHSSVDATKTALDYHRDKDCMKHLFKELKEHVTKTINYVKTKLCH